MKRYLNMTDPSMFDHAPTKKSQNRRFAAYSSPLGNTVCECHEKPLFSPLLSSFPTLRYSTPTLLHPIQYTLHF